MYILIFRISTTEKELVQIDEGLVNYSITNGIDNPAIERSRSPSPTLDVPFFNPSESFNNNRAQNNYSSFGNTGQTDVYTVNYGSDISQILKEVNSITRVIQHTVSDTKNENVSIYFIVWL